MFKSRREIVARPGDELTISNGRDIFTRKISMTDEDRDFRFALGENDSEMASNLPVFYKD
jgi:hypothetical protein